MVTHFVYFGEDLIPVDCHRICIDGIWHDDIEAQMLCAWAFQQGLDWAESERKASLRAYAQGFSIGFRQAKWQYQEVIIGKGL